MFCNRKTSGVSKLFRVFIASNIQTILGIHIGTQTHAQEKGNLKILMFA